mmetsp:Transcript_60255/g.160353  ORF Transcript_60255/g.160353 Transcript_60255/m.160353 type:complete len:247 (+) Transcript_60255:442-1182(+)
MRSLGASRAYPPPSPPPPQPRRSRGGGGSELDEHPAARRGVVEQRRAVLRQRGQRRAEEEGGHAPRRHEDLGIPPHARVGGAEQQVVLGLVARRIDTPAVGQQPAHPPHEAVAEVVLEQLPGAFVAREAAGPEGRGDEGVHVERHQHPRPPVLLRHVPREVLGGGVVGRGGGIFARQPRPVHLPRRRREAHLDLARGGAGEGAQERAALDLSLLRAPRHLVGVLPARAAPVAAAVAQRRRLGGRDD